MQKWQTNYYLYNAITDFLIDNKIKYSCNVRSLCKKKGWRLIPYPDKDYLRFSKISSDGFSVFKNNDFYIFYNPFQQASRINFTIAHEIGHIVLYHHSILKKSILAKGSKDISEHQANIFAQNLLMPISITLEQSKIKNVQELSEQFDVSQSMVRTRLDKLNSDLFWFKKIFYNSD